MPVCDCSSPCFNPAKWTRPCDMPV
ncbi:hypothetical protein F383_37639 [Gossypium arboreum]|uniref:Uncharacterized protein n=1 Tax=Gossypium arboreum TaxID=29729 RepID=A0A0B0MDH5_GOSAR|nr:hypothetical protein F383_37639 [Gossypium arboreum]